MFTESDYALGAARLRVDVPAVKAVADVESNGVTHWPGGLVPILLEAHHFGRLTGYRFNVTNPGVSCSSWDEAKRLYRGGPAEYERLAEARALNESAALQACSWGAFQVMGFNWRGLGYASVQELVSGAQTPSGQFEAFLRYIEADPTLHDALRRHDWHVFAGRYNGQGQVDYYSAKMAEAYRRWSGTPTAPVLPTMFKGSKGADVAKLQAALGIRVDGDFGPLTEAAVKAFQAAHGLLVDGLVGPQTRAALGI